jgi:hypothetical protein
VLALAQELRLVPAAVDDIPVDMRVEQPVHMRVFDTERRGTRPERGAPALFIRPRSSPFFLSMDRMRLRILLPVLATLGAAPLAAQQAGLPSYCRPDTVTRPDVVARSALRKAIEDSLRTEIVAAARQAGVAEPAGLVAIQIRDRRRGRAQATAFRANVADSVVDAAVAPRAALLARWPERSEWLHVRLDGPFPPADARVECLPAIENSDWFVRELGRVLSADRSPPGQMGGSTATLRMLVSRDGDVVFATLSRTSPRSGVNHGVLNAARGLRFRPASFGGVPVDVWVEQPVQF